MNWYKNNTKKVLIFYIFLHFCHICRLQNVINVCLNEFWAKNGLKKWYSTLLYNEYNQKYE